MYDCTYILELVCSMLWCLVPASSTSRVMAIIRGSPRPNIAVASWKTNVLVGLAVAQVAVAQAHMNECYVGGVKLKDFKP